MYVYVHAITENSNIKSRRRILRMYVKNPAVSLKGTRPSTCYAKKTIALAKINYSPSFTAFRAGKGKRETEREREKETSAL